jgi:hypothetical protein
VAVISDQFWRRQFAADPQVVGRPLELKGHARPPLLSAQKPGWEHA